MLVVACLPDIDYLFEFLRLQIDGKTVRITHSFIGALLLPVMTGITLWLINRFTDKLAVCSLTRMITQLILAGLSHLCLDLFTGVSSLPLLYPFSTRLVRLPFGLLPSAGRLQLDNYFLYRNLFIELGVLVPLTVGSVLLLRHRLSLLKVLVLSLSIGIAIGFMTWAFHLGR
ncbi:MAG: metal-dependent hydrolase [Leptolyngbya sp. SIO3F4]|nr:metal-dependent hydrolase [Leptolyngbya sp. SIO3F4]